MRQFFMVIFVFLMMFSAIIAGNKPSYKGYLVDNQCAPTMVKHPEKAYMLAKKHSRSCALEETCASAGYGIMTANGKFLKFDAAGDKKAHTFLEKSKKKNEILVQVSGKFEGDVLLVNEITNAKK